MKSLNLHALSMVALISIGSGFALAQDKPSTIDGVKGVKQEAVANIKNVAPPTAIPVTPPPPQGVKQETVADIKNVAPPTAAPAAANAAQGMNKVDGVNTIDGVKASGREAVQPPPPPPPAGSTTNVAGGAVGAVSSIRAVKGVQGIIAPKQLNLEAALAIKQDGGGTPAGGGAEKGGAGKAAAAALLNAPGGRTPVKPLPGTDGRAALQEFEKQTAPGS